MITRPLITLTLALFLGAPAYGVGGDSGTKQPSEYKMAVKAVKKEDFTTASELLRKVVEDDPENADAWNYMGYSLRNLGHYDQALAAYETALELEPKHKGALEYLGELYLQIDQPDKAKQLLQRLDDACLFTCKEYRELKAEISKYDGGP